MDNARLEKMRAECREVMRDVTRRYEEARKTCTNRACYLNCHCLDALSRYQTMKLDIIGQSYGLPPHVYQVEKH